MLELRPRDSTCHSKATEPCYLSYKVLLHYNLYTRIFLHFRTYQNNDNNIVLHNDITKPVLELTGV